MTSPSSSSSDTAPTSAQQDPELHWLRHVYQPGARQLTVRAVITGMIIGAVMCLSNLYVVLKTGWSIGVTITACIIAFAMFKVFQAMRLTRTPFTPLENNAMGSVASAAGYMTGGGNIAALAALLLLGLPRPDSIPMILWFGTISALGVFAAIPIKRQLVNIEQLPFPTGTATATTIKALHAAEHAAETAGGAAPKVAEGQQAKWLGIAGLFGAVVVLLRGFKLIPETLALPFKLAGVAASKFTWAFDLSPLLIGAGALMSWRTGWSMLLGAIVTHGILVPMLHTQGVIPELGFKNIIQWTLWGGAGLMVSSGLLSFAFQWKSVARSLGALRGVKGREAAEQEELAKVEPPGWWFPAGFAAIGPVVIFLAWWLFDIPWWAGLLALPLAVLMGTVAARVTGETDTTPTKALGPVTQTMFGIALPGHMTANVMGANITGGVGLHAADLLTDLKSGFLLGANPRKQVIAQLFGCVAGALIVVPAFNVLIPTAETLGTSEWPAPAAQVWAGVSKVLVDGFGALHSSARLEAAICFGIGILLTLIERFAPARARAFIPSPGALGIAMMVPAYNSISFAIGAGIAELARRRKPQTADATTLPVASGAIAGESLMGILIAMLVAFKVIPK